MILLFELGVSFFLMLIAGLTLMSVFQTSQTISGKELLYRTPYFKSIQHERCAQQRGVANDTIFLCEESSRFYLSQS